MIHMNIKLLDPYATIPTYAKAGDAGADLYSIEDFLLWPGQRRLVRTGIALEIPTGFVGLVHPRSGLANKFGVTVANAPGTIDAGYRGEVLVNLVNHGEYQQSFKAGDRIAQLVIQEVYQAHFTVVDELSETERGEGGHGSTGLTNGRPAYTYTVEINNPGPHAVLDLNLNKTMNENPYQDKIDRGRIQ